MCFFPSSIDALWISETDNLTEIIVVRVTIIIIMKFARFT